MHTAMLAAVKAGAKAYSTTKGVFNTLQAKQVGNNHSLSSSCEGREEGKVLFNEALNTIYLRLCGVGHMVKDHSYSKRGNPLLPHGLLFPISSKEGPSQHSISGHSTMELHLTLQLQKKEQDVVPW